MCPFQTQTGSSLKDPLGAARQVKSKACRFTAARVHVAPTLQRNRVTPQALALTAAKVFRERIITAIAARKPRAAMHAREQWIAEK
jgi:hypothetical protein